MAGFAFVEPIKPEPAPLQCVNNVRVWTHPDMPRRTVELRDKAGKVLAVAHNVETIHVGSDY